MARVKGGLSSHKRKKKVLKETKGFRWGRKSKYRLAHTATLKAGVSSYRGRKEKKRNFRKLWQVQINAACHNNDMNYSRFMQLLKDNNIKLNRKVLAELAVKEPEIFQSILELLK